MKKILLIEDDKFLVRVIKVKLEKAGYDVKFLESGKQVKQTVDTWGPDLILLDFAIPDKDGFEVLRELKQHQKLKKTPVLAVSQLQMDEDIHLMYELGSSFYINKSESTFNEIINVVNNILLNN